MSSVFVKAALAASLLAGGALFFPACEDSDPTAPQGSTITVSASPSTVGPNEDSTIKAILRSGSGTRLPDQEVTFNTNAGRLDPPAQTPILTDDNGVAVSVLMDLTRTATVEAQSGTVAGSVTVTFQTCNVSEILLNIVPQNIGSCTGPQAEVEVTATVLDSQGIRCTGTPVVFNVDHPSSGLNFLSGTIIPQQGVTDANGELQATFTPGVACGTDCVATGPNGGACEADFTATDTSGNVVSPVVTLSETIQ